MSGIEASFDFEACQALMRGGSKTFFAASRLLPPVYEIRRLPCTPFVVSLMMPFDFSDDRATALSELNRRLSCIYEGRPQPFECDRALAAVVHEFDMPLLLLTALLEGFQWDAEGRRHRTLDELQAYAARVAGSVGAMMAVIMRTRKASALARACDSRVAMQLTNIARDVGEDARAVGFICRRSGCERRGLNPKPGWPSRYLMLGLLA